MSMGLSFLPNAMDAVVSAQKQTAAMRNQLSQQANERRGRELAQTHQVMASSFDTLGHALTARGGLVDFTA
jgi:hypothetical protein